MELSKVERHGVEDLSPTSVGDVGVSVIESHSVDFDQNGCRVQREI